MPGSHRQCVQRAQRDDADKGLHALALCATETDDLMSAHTRQAGAHDSDLVVALRDPRTAGDAELYAATPRLQEPLVLERLGDLDSAVAAHLADPLVPAARRGRPPAALDHPLVAGARRLAPAAPRGQKRILTIDRPLVYRIGGPCR